MHKIFVGALSAPLLVIGTSGMALADNVGGLFGALFGGPTFAPMTNERYGAECSGCHVAFPPELLPADAWGRVIDTLKNHFGDNASLDPAATKELRGYLTANAGKGNSTKGPHAIAAKTPTSDNPPRITDTDYFHGRHNEISARFVKANSKIGSFANCQACHLDAAEGTYSEEKVIIPKKEG
ncbi:MAG TPA: cytochrome C [Lamprocystis sp. (in: g-proteobacteria)]|nr:cytochrome C [Lamprocystis sp. (in: g-proteobacteria)]